MLIPRKGAVICRNLLDGGTTEWDIDVWKELLSAFIGIVFILATFSCRPLSKSYLCVESSVCIVQCNCSVQLMSVMECLATKIEMSTAYNTVAKNVGRISTDPKGGSQGIRTDPCRTSEV